MSFSGHLSTFLRCLIFSPWTSPFDLRQFLDGMALISGFCLWLYLPKPNSTHHDKPLPVRPDFTSTLREQPKHRIQTEEQCPICKRGFLDPDELDVRPLALPCGHIWCEDCIQEYIVVQQRITQCPLCLKDFRRFGFKWVRWQTVYAHIMLGTSISLCVMTILAIFHQGCTLGWLLCPISEDGSNAKCAAFYLENEYLRAIAVATIGLFTIPEIACFLWDTANSDDALDEFEPVLKVMRICTPLWLVAGAHLSLKTVLEDGIWPVRDWSLSLVFWIPWTVTTSIGLSMVVFLIVQDTRAEEERRERQLQREERLRNIDRYFLME